MRWRSTAVNASLAVGTVLLLCVAAELMLRFLLLGNLNPFTPDPELGFRLKTDFEGLYPRAWVRTDGNGLRVPMDQDGDSGGRLLFGGDSVTFGFGVAAEQSFPYVTGRALGAPHDVAIAAVPGYNLGQALALLRENVSRQRPRLVVVGLVVNDIGSAADSATYTDIDPHAARSERGGFLSHSLFVAFLERRLRRIAARNDTPDERNSAFVAVDDFATWLPEETVAAFDAQWGQLEALQLETGVPIYVLLCPYREQVDGVAGDAYQAFVAERCAGSPLRCLDPLAVMRASGSAEELFNGVSTYHYTPRGHRVLGEWLAGHLGS